MSLTIQVHGQTQLARHVVASGGILASPNGNATMLLSATVGQSIILKHTRGDNTTIYQGFWLPLNFGIVGVDDDNSSSISGDVSNYPNPFAYSTTIRFNVPMDGRVTIRMFNLAGEIVRTIIAEVSAAGSQEILVMATDDFGAPLASGTYLYDVDGTTVSGTPLRRMQRLSILR
ncbi:MAG: hypothetical protein H7X70_02735 [Candidatus Kapabacteria bacterium]|nr:hypothetical protein [Candidatus Kapabacteria bacterium]